MASFRLLTTAAASTLLFNKKLLFAPPVSSIRRCFNTNSVQVFHSDVSRHRLHDFFSGGGSGGVGKDWEVKENNEALNLRFEMPGLDKEDVKVYVVKFLTLVINATESKKQDSEEEPIHYLTKFVMQPDVFNLTKIQAEMNNGVLKLVVPKIKPEEWADAYELEIE
ncbi:hypothetical protein QVD17_28217 [Tagetes erecta]|uniref:SHSP domain-containing protein n=1 Tax=Tagetes erecta TaxID=13708 RepID=A0AAD8K9Y6_TARER|nr:hypothetical protein QVD17_28217 [Tagetes erecta]